MLEINTRRFEVLFKPLACFTCV